MILSRPRPAEEPAGIPSLFAARQSGKAPPMKKDRPRIVKYVLVVFGLLTFLLLLFINSNLAALAEMLRPGTALWTHAVLFAAEALALAWFWRALFGRRRHLLLVDNATEEERRVFSRELARRMRYNPLIKQAGLDAEFQSGQDEEAFLDRCMLLLETRANEEIRQNARRIFLASALSQNGKLDALIVFVSLCRLVWRVSAIYNQRPHPREIVSLYGAVITSAFLALSIEELDIPTEIAVGFGKAFHAMAPAGLTASIPFAGKALQTFTASAVDGAANCYLGLRAGIITRNAYAYGARQSDSRPSRAAVYKEAGALLLDMSHTLMNGLAATLAGGLAGAAGYAGKKTARAGKDVVDGISKVGSDLGASAGRLASETVSTVQSAGSGLMGAGRNTGAAVGSAVGKVGSAVDKAASAAAGLLRLPFARKIAKKKE